MSLRISFLVIVAIITFLAFGVSIYGVVSNAIIYAQHQVTLTSGNCTILGCVLSESTRESYRLYIKNYTLETIYDSHGYIGTYLEFSRHFPSYCTTGNATATCYFDWMNINGTLSLNPLIDYTKVNARDVMILSAICLILVVTFIAGLIIKVAIDRRGDYIPLIN